MARDPNVLDSKKAFQGRDPMGKPQFCAPLNARLPSLIRFQFFQTENWRGGGLYGTSLQFDNCSPLCQLFSN